ncbi:hypothetical protein niasHT_025192 [Heterodera trifolii]|uniref:Cyclin C-terminal domain-containing protein n=1 Tax=Heterodera trifolii TaxID=157864 RepID=A0ABD2JLC9_9BILA
MMMSPPREYCRPVKNPSRRQADSNFWSVTKPNTRPHCHATTCQKNDSCPLDGAKMVTSLLRWVLSGLKFNLSVQYSMQFLRSYRFYASPSKSVWAFAKFISEIALVCYALAHFPPSVVAAVSLNLAAFAYGCPLQSPELFVNVFRMSEAAVERISRSFVDHVIQFLDPTAKLGALREKYRRHFVITNEQLALLRDFDDHLRKPNNGLLDVPR